MSAYYNEHDPKTAAWLRQLISENRIAPGVVDERSILEVKPHELTAYTQCHFFAGIGGWSLALRLAGWPDDRPVWTGSCPCQPFSTAGKGLGDKDERHLWPVFFELIRQCRPEHVFGEQVASAIGKGWLDGVSADLESEGYACGAAVLGAHSVGAPHIRQRLYWVADSQLQHERSTRPHEEGARDAAGVREASGMGDSSSVRLSKYSEQHGEQEVDTANRDSRGQHADGLGGYLWSDFQFAQCRDGKTRRVPTEPSFFPLAHGVPARVVRLRGYGNAIVPQVAAVFVKAFDEIHTANA